MRDLQKGFGALDVHRDTVVAVAGWSLGELHQGKLLDHPKVSQVVSSSRGRQVLLHRGMVGPLDGCADSSRISSGMISESHWDWHC